MTRTGTGEWAKTVVQRLRGEYPDARCALLHRNPYELIVSTILSAQCTDEMVNRVTPELFRRYATVESLAKARLPSVEKLVKSTGFFRNKARNIIGMAKKLVPDFKGNVPQTMEDLLTLPGVARKTANVVLGVAFGKAEGLVVDTHVHRLTCRLGLTKEDDPKRIERDLDGGAPPLRLDGPRPPPHLARPPRVRREEASLRRLRAQGTLPEQRG